MSGSLEITIGPMFSGKSSWLIKKMEELKRLNIPHLAIRFSNDNRYSKNGIDSHNGTTFVAKNATTVEEIKHLLDKHPNLVALGIDEVQFFEKEIANLLRELKNKGIAVYAAGLDTDFLGVPWETTTEALKHANIVNKLKAVCSVCNKRIATQTQRLINGIPARKDHPRILIGAKDSYTARCKPHHQIG